MRFDPLPIAGARALSFEPRADERGFFGRLWCREEALQAGISFDVVQVSASYSPLAGTLRGMHFAWPPSREAKVVRCVRGRVYDVLLDLRPTAPSFLRWHARVLDADTHDALYVPPGVAHGFQTLADDSELHYLMNEAYRPDWQAGVRFDDHAFAIDWPLPVASISPRDRQGADFDPVEHGRRWYAALAGGGADHA